VVTAAAMVAETAVVGAATEEEARAMEAAAMAVVVEMATVEEAKVMAVAVMATGVVERATAAEGCRARTRRGSRLRVS
jgi:hypothetical protein